MQKLLITLIGILVFNTCNNNPVATDTLQLGRRDYTWSVDTLNIPFTILESIWGTSPADVWAVGKGGDLGKTIFHYNGSKWTTDGISRNISPRTIWGFSANDIWIGGANTFWHFDGNHWNAHTNFTIPGFTYCGIEDIWGDNPNNIYAVGYAENNERFTGLVMHYDGTQWKQSSVPMQDWYNFDRIRRGENTNYYILGIRVEQFAEDTMKIFEVTNNLLKEVFKGGIFERIENELFFSVNKQIYIYSSNQFYPLIYINEINFGVAIWGRNKKDLFLRMQDGIAHFNGTDIQYLYSFNHGISISDAIIFQQNIFFLAYDFNNGLNLIIKGKIN